MPDLRPERPRLSTDAAPQSPREQEARAVFSRARLSSLWEEHRRWVAAILLVHKPSVEDLDDLLQEVAATFFTKAHTIRDEGSLKAWLRVVAINTARAAARATRYRPMPGGSLHEESAVSEAPVVGAVFAGRAVRTVSERADLQERYQDLLSRLHALPEMYREPLLLRTVQGLSSREVAEILAITPATVDTRVARARRMLAAGPMAEGREDDNGP